MTERVRLTEMIKGQRGRVVSVKGRGAYGKRIRDMGVVPGVEIFVEGEAPLGDPIEIKVMDYNLTLRRSEAENILLELVG
jgi:Fe2+ transport system protein FeoA